MSKSNLLFLLALFSLNAHSSPDISCTLESDYIYYENFSGGIEVITEQCINSDNSANLYVTIIPSKQQGVKFTINGLEQPWQVLEPEESRTWVIKENSQNDVFYNYQFFGLDLVY